MWHAAFGDLQSYQNCTRPHDFMIMTPSKSNWSIKCEWGVFHGNTESFCGLITRLINETYFLLGKMPLSFFLEKNIFTSMFGSFINLLDHIFVLYVMMYWFSLTWVNEMSGYFKKQIKKKAYSNSKYVTNISTNLTQMNRIHLYCFDWDVWYV